MSGIGKSLYSLVWLAGAIALIYWSNRLLEHARHLMETTYKLNYGIWLPILIAFVFGVYLAFERGLPKRVNLRTGSLIIFAVTFVGLLYLVMAYYGKVPYYDPFIRLINSNNGNFILGVTSGYSMMKSVFK